MAVGLEWPDILVICLYFVLVMAVGVWATCKKAETSTAGGYFLAGRSATWFRIGASTFATNIGAPMFVGVAGSAARYGITVVMFEWHAMWMLVLLGWFFLPVYLSCGCYTMPQYLHLRFGGQRIRTWLAVVNTMVIIVSLLAGQMYAGALFIQLVFGWDLYVSLAFILFLTAVYTVVGGLTALMWTDILQTIILFIGATILYIIGMNEIGSFTNMRELFMEAAPAYAYQQEALYGNHTCAFPPPESFNLFNPADDPVYPSTGMIFGLTILALNYWCTDQLVVQRSLSAKTLSHGKGGLLLAAYLKILPWFFFMVPGMISRCLYPQEVACADPTTCQNICDNPTGCYDIAYPMLVNYMLPTGVRGLMMAALLAALMSSLTATFNSSSTIVSLDLWRVFRPKAKEGELMVVGRLWTGILAIVSLAWMPILLLVKGSDFWTYSQSVASYLNPPILAVFLCGLCWKRTTEIGAFIGLIVGLVVGVIRMGLEWSRPGSPCGDPTPSNAFDVVAKVNFLHFACILFGCVVVTTITVSLFTKPRPEEKLRRVTWWTRNSPEPQELSSESDDREPEVSEEEDVSEEELKRRQSSPKYFMLKWFCGIDKTKKKPPKISKEELKKLQEEATNIKEDPFWGSVLNQQAVLCCAVCSFIHFFWGWGGQ